MMGKLGSADRRSSFNAFAWRFAPFRDRTIAVGSATHLGGQLSMLLWGLLRVGAPEDVDTRERHFEDFVCPPTARWSPILRGAALASPSWSDACKTVSRASCRKVFPHEVLNFMSDAVLSQW